MSVEPQAASNRRVDTGAMVVKDEKVVYVPGVANTQVKMKNGVRICECTPDCTFPWKNCRKVAFRFVWNNYHLVPDWKNRLEEMFTTYSQMSYLCGSEEVAPSTGTKHIQGYLHMSTATLLHEVVGKFPKDLFAADQSGRNHRMHWSVQHCRAGVEDNVLYVQGLCKKKDNSMNETFFEWGQRPKDIPPFRQEEYVKRIKDGETVEQILQGNFQLNVQQIRLLREYASAFPSTRRNSNDEIRIIYAYGTTGVGKSHAGWEEFPDAYDARDGYNWDEYQRQLIVNVEDFRDSFMKYSDLLALLQNRPFRANKKYGAVQVLATTFYLSSSQLPTECYLQLKNDRQDQFLRRISELRFYFKKYTAPVVLDLTKVASVDDYKPRLAAIRQFCRQYPIREDEPIVIFRDED